VDVYSLELGGEFSVSHLQRGKESSSNMAALLFILPVILLNFQNSYSANNKNAQQSEISVSN
jgi:hypothetical protein